MSVGKTIGGMIAPYPFVDPRNIGQFRFQSTREAADIRCGARLAPILFSQFANLSNRVREILNCSLTLGTSRGEMAGYAAYHCAEYELEKFEPGARTFGRGGRRRHSGCSVHPFRTRFTDIGPDFLNKAGVLRTGHTKLHFELISGKAPFPHQSSESLL